MYVDNQLVLSDAQAFAATALTTNVIDLGGIRAIGSGKPLVIAFQCDVAADQTTGDETYQFDIETASDAAMTTARQFLNRRIFQAGTPTAPNEDADLLVAGFIFYEVIPQSKLSEGNRFLAVRYTGSGTTPTITMTIFLTAGDMTDVQNTFPKGYVIS